MMRNSYLAVLATAVIASTAIAGDDSSGPIKYRVDLGAPFTTYQLTEQDKAWSQHLAKKFKYTGSISYFVRTSLTLDVDGKAVEEAVYQRLDQPDCFYVVPGDYVLTIGTPWPASPGVGGFTLCAPRSRTFLACMNCHCGGVPALSSTPIEKGPVSWSGHDTTRF
jgi:hypothetical protein